LICVIAKFEDFQFFLLLKLITIDFKHPTPIHYPIVK